tara:strand:- start:35377 stop:37014 length:1638 start_codon:yes stop_codon:yes gene_type:complete
MKQQVNQILKRLEQLESFRAPWETLWQDCTDFVNPRRGDFQTKQARGSRARFDKVFDSTAPLANEQLASGLHGHLTNVAERWFHLRVPGQNSSAGTHAWLQQAVGIMFDKVFNIAESNFITSVHELYLDLGAYGTAVIFVEDKPGKPIGFRSFHLADCYVAENHEGVVDTVYRRYKHTARQLMQLYADVLPEKIKEIATKQPFQEFTCVHAVEPRADLDYGKKDKNNMPFKSCYVLVEEQIMLKEGGFQEFPYMVPRWSKTSGEVYGRSPSMMCMPDIKMVNEMMKTTIRAAQKATDPPLLVPDDGFMMPLRTVPGGLNYYRSGTPDKVEPLIGGERPDVGLDFIESRREHIKKAFHVDWLQMREGPQMTATEVMQRQEEKMRLMGPMVGRLQSEFLGPMITRVFQLMMRRKELPPVPQELEGIDLQLDYVSPVARAQKAQAVFNFSRFMEQMIPLANVKPEIFDNIDADATFRWAHKTLDAPVETLTNPDQVQEIRQQKAEQMQQMEERGAMAQDAATAKDMAKAAKDVGMEEMVGGALGGQAQ